MLSMPPATRMELVPATMASWASITAFMPEPHILLTVVAPAESGIPAWRAAWRSGAWPRPAGSTQPMIVSSMSSGVRPARAIAALMAAVPSSGEVTDARSPWKPPMAVRAMPTTTIGSACVPISMLLLRISGTGVVGSDLVARAAGFLDHIGDVVIVIEIDIGEDVVIALFFLELDVLVQEILVQILLGLGGDRRLARPQILDN